MFKSRFDPKSERAIRGLAFQNEVQKAIQDNDPLPPGNYVIKGSIIKIDEEGNVSRAL